MALILHRPLREFGRDLPPDFFLKEVVEVDLSNADEILTFTEEWGPIYRPDEPLDLLPWPDRKLPHLMGMNQRARDMATRHNPATSHPIVLSVDLCRYHLQLLRIAVEHWAAYARRIEPADGEWTEDERWRRFLQILNAALAPLQVRVVMPQIQAGSNPLDLAGGVTVYTAAALQLVNAVKAADTLRICESETCGRLFTRQRGGAVQGQYRSEGIKYCSVSCARAQANRTYRRRNKAPRP